MTHQLFEIKALRLLVVFGYVKTNHTHHNNPKEWNHKNQLYENRLPYQTVCIYQYLRGFVWFSSRLFIEPEKIYVNWVVLLCWKQQTVSRFTGWPWRPWRPKIVSRKFGVLRNSTNSHQMEVYEFLFRDFSLGTVVKTELSFTLHEKYRISWVDEWLNSLLRRMLLHAVSS
jgi:hypothetical protein